MACGTAWQRSSNSVKVGDKFGSDAVVGNNCLIQAYACVAHDCKVGDYVRVDTHCTCVGGVIIEDGATIHTSAVLSHGVVVEENAVVGACSFVIKRVKAGITVVGNPARRLSSK
jgi:Acyl-[acyl carrier protein]--UDP-N-acetylglucosamine O-acyltransferase